MTTTISYPVDLILPADYERTSQAYPLLLFLHGRGECGVDLTLVRRHGPPRLAREATRPLLLDRFIILSPQCPVGNSWSTARLDALLTATLQQTRIDPARLYLTGVSMGGHGAWSLALEQPERFAALCPICGWSEPARADRLQRLPIWLFHSAADDVVPVAESDRMFAALQRCDAEATYTRYRHLDHVATWEDAYARAGLYEWLLSHRARP